MHAGSDPPSFFGTGHVTVLSTPPRKTMYSGVHQHRCSSALDFCSEGVKRTAKSSLPMETHPESTYSHSLISLAPFYLAPFYKEIISSFRVVVVVFYIIIHSYIAL